jgi:hypothetical protein
VVEQVLRGGRCATLEDQTGIHEALERVLEPLFREITDRSC